MKGIAKKKKVSPVKSFIIINIMVTIKISVSRSDQFSFELNSA